VRPPARTLGADTRDGADRPRLRFIVDDAYELELPACWLERGIVPTELTVCNVSTTMGYQVSPLAQADDGKLEAQIVPRMETRARLRRAVALAVQRRNIIGQSDEVSRPLYIRFNKLRLEWHALAAPRAEDDGWLATDGTLQEGVEGVPCEIECLPAALRFITALALTRD